MIQQDNERILALMNAYLRCAPTCVKKVDIRSLVSECGIAEKEAFASLLAAYCGLEVDGRDSAFYRQYFPRMIQALDANTYKADPYYANIHMPNICYGKCRMGTLSYAPYEGFVCDDFLLTADKRIIPQIGYFPREFAYPALCENEQVWMSITPNEINTMKTPITRARGNVLTYGLGLGYFAYMAARKESVQSVTVVENNVDVIAMFQKYLLPQFECGQKISIIQDDAFVYAQKPWAVKYDVVFADIWHDVGDGIAMHRQLKAAEKIHPECEYLYWIEKSMNCYSE